MGILKGEMAANPTALPLALKFIKEAPFAFISLFCVVDDLTI